MSASYLTEESDQLKLDECAPCFRPIAAFVLYEAQRHLDEVEPGRFVVRIAVAGRSHRAQWDAYSKGRARLSDGAWELVRLVINGGYTIIGIDRNGYYGPFILHETDVVWL